MVKVKFLQDAYTATTDEHFLTTTTYPPRASHATPATGDIGAGAGAAAAAAAAPSAAAVAHIQSVRNILPDLQPAFVAALLARYADSPEQVIAAVLEGNLPPDLLQPTERPSSPVKPTAKAAPAAVRSDPFGFGDGADVIVKRNKGFPGQARTVAALLDDKTHVQQLRSRYQEWGLVTESTGDNGGNDYDDEYDDSYDALAESERRSGAALRATAVRNPNRAVRDELPDGDDDELDEEEEDEEEEAEAEASASGGRAGGGGGGGSSYYDKTKNFCENPEVARERRAQQWNNKWAAKAPRKPTTAGGGTAAGGGAPSQTRPGGG